MAVLSPKFVDSFCQIVPLLDLMFTYSLKQAVIYDYIKSSSQLFSYTIIYQITDSIIFYQVSASLRITN
jgi:hypothetical protein